MNQHLKILNEERIELISLFAIDVVYSMDQALDFYVEDVEVNDNYLSIYVTNIFERDKNMLVKINRHNDETTISIQAIITHGWRVAVNESLKHILNEARNQALIFQKMKQLEQKLKNNNGKGLMM